MLKTVALTHPLRMPKALPRPRIVKDESSPVFLINFARCDFLSCSFKKIIAGILFVYLSIHLCAAITMTVSAARVHSRYEALAASIRADLPNEMNIDQLYSQMDALHFEISNRIQWMNGSIQLAKRRFPAAEKLAALTRSLPENTWLTKVQGSASQKIVTIEALHYVEPDQAFQLPVASWMQSLRQDSQFKKDLKQIELKSSSQHRQGKSELQKFELVAEWAGAE